MSIFKQSLPIALAFILVFVWAQLAPRDFTIPVIGLLALSYLLLSKFKKKDTSIQSGLASMDHTTIAILLSLILLIIMTTGGISSPLYFLLYFVPFAITFTLLPEVVFVFLIGCVLIFLPTALADNVTENLIKLASLGLIAPLAYFFGKEFRAVERHQQQDNEIAKKISTEAANVLKDGQTLPESDKAQLVDIIAESEELKQN